MSNAGTASKLYSNVCEARSKTNTQNGTREMTTKPLVPRRLRHARILKKRRYNEQQMHGRRDNVATKANLYVASFTLVTA